MESLGHHAWLQWCLKACTLASCVPAALRAHPSASTPPKFGLLPIHASLPSPHPVPQYPGDTGFTQWDKARHEREQREAITMSRLGSAPVEATIK